MSKTIKSYPASLVQRQFWLAQQLNAESTAYNIASAFIFGGSFREDLFVDCLQEIIARYENFRTRFEIIDGELHQCVLDEPSMSVAVKDIECKDETSFAVESKRLLNEAAASPFDLAKDPPIRLVVVHGKGSNQHAACIVLHHIYIDLRTKDLLAAEIAARYNSKLVGKEYKPSEEALQYGDYCQWQGDWLQTDKPKRMTQFWQEHLQGRTLSIPLQTDFPRANFQSFEGSLERFEIDDELTDSIKQFSSEREVSPFVTLLAAYFALLYRYTRSEDFVVGVPLSNRRVSKFENMMGCFVNTLPLSIDIEAEDTFDVLVRKTRTAMLVAHRNQEVTLELIAGTLSMAKDPSRNPIYQVGFTFEHPMRLELDDTQVEQVPCDTKGAQLDLFLRLWQSGKSINAQIEYNTDLFRRETAERFAGNYLTLVRSATQNSEYSVDHLSVVSPKDLGLMQQWNDTRRSYHLVPLHNAFERQVEKTPDARALLFCGDTLTYREFNNRANQLSRYLTRLGVKPGDLVAVCLDRSFEMLISIYAIMKAGAAYVPIEPEFPAKRIEQMFANIGEVVSLATRETATKLENAKTTIVKLDADGDKIEQEKRDNPDIEVGLEDLAYVIYTSGTTGTPKGVMNSHRGIANRVCWMQETFGLEPTESVLAKTPFGFDPSVVEMFWPLQVGAALEIAPPGAHRDPEALAKLIPDSGISTTHFVPSMLETYLAYPWRTQPSKLKRVVCSGEALSLDLKDNFYERFPGVELHNLYGPTEAAVDVTHWHCQKEEKNVAPIGRAIANTQIYILDVAGEQTAIGIPGEICIGGIQVAKGYLNDPGLTNEKFVDNPFTKEPTKLYRTGDLGRFLPDGNIQYLGRLDHQVKIRGNRIELGEIEIVLRAHPAVKEAVVLARSVAGRPLELVAYIVGEKSIGPEPLRRHVAESLPEYMTPAFFAFIDEIPHTASGKIDRKTLGRVEIDTHLPEREAISPTTDLEKYLAQIWMDVLRLERIGIRDNFFDIGGNSLLLMRVFAKLKENYGEELHISALFEHSSIERLAWFLEKGSRADQEQAERDRQRADRAKEARQRARKRGPR